MIEGHAHFSRISLSCSKKLRNLLGSSSKQKVVSALVDLIQQMGDEDADDDDDDVHCFPSTSGCYSLSSVLKPDWPYTVGRSNRHAQFIFKDPRVSKQHCQILFDASIKKLYLLNGALTFSSSSYCGRNGICIVKQFRNRLLVKDKGGETLCSDCTYKFKASLNGVFVNGVKVGEGVAVELCAGDEVLLICSNRNGACGSQSRIGFIVRRIVFQEEVVIPGHPECQFVKTRLVRPLLSGKVNKRVFALIASDSESPSSECDDVVGRAKSLSAHCNRILHSRDPVSCILQSMVSRSHVGGSRISKDTKFQGLKSSHNMHFPERCEPQANVPVSRQQKLPLDSLDVLKGNDILRGAMMQSTDSVVSPCLPKAGQFYQEGCGGAVSSIKVENNIAEASTLANDNLGGRNQPQSEATWQSRRWKESIPAPAKSFYLNRLESMHSSPFSRKDVVSLPELLHPVSNISRMFIATFTSDIQWFLSYCAIPSHLPVTLACHNTERCWSGDPEKRSCVPYPDFPNLLVVYPPFPEVIAFGKDRMRQGVACHHPKLLVLQREDTIRVIITSANLVAKQWTNVTNTIWWQDFPRRNYSDWASLFNKIHIGHANCAVKSDFAAQLAGFMAMLVTDVPSQAFWIVELTKYDFEAANAYLVASVPGIYSYRSPSATIPAYKFKCPENFFGSVEASVVGLSHFFRAATDSNGVQLKRLAAYLGKFSEGCGMSEIILKRDKNVTADANAVSVLVPNQLESSRRDCVQLGFLPRTVAKWVSPLWDIGFFSFFGYVCPREALAAAFGQNNNKVQLILYVSQGPNFHDITKMLEPERVVAFCSFIASIQRCTGVWRLEEVLQPYKWPEHLESDFVYGSSSIGTSVNAQFLATFSSAAGKRSQQLFDSEESDPEWGYWNASHELKHPSMRIVFPTIERVRSASCGIMPSRHILCFSEKTWQRLKIVNVLHDAIPYPSDRVGYPMHVKVARRRFQSKEDGSSFGWIYCGSHNLSAAAWGRQISGADRGCSCSSDLRLHICNYELGIVFIFPPPESKGKEPNKSSSLDDIHLPFVVPAPKYGPGDRPATKHAMREAFVELAERERGSVPAEADAMEEMVEEVPEEEAEEENVVEVVNYVALEDEDEKAYADVLWSQVNSSQSRGSKA